ncbi:MAG: FtsX-like permease family protein, partial [Proteobacteria bacterium]|nr:FtsX-like permease family protein [Pseudomonadota bacterium]
VCAVAIAAILLPSIREILAPFLGTAITVTIQKDSVVTALIMGTLGTPIAALPVFLHLEGMSAATLFREHQDPSRIKPLGWLMAALPSTAIIFGLASWQARSPKAGILFLMITGIAILILAGSGILLLRSLGPFSRLIKQKTGRKSWPILMALRHTMRSGQTLMVSFVTLGLCAALISAVPQIQAILTSELTSSDKTVLPGLFLFDIQPEQEAPLRQFLESRNLSSGSLSPLIRARLDRINDKITGETFDNIPGTRERQTEEQFKNRTYNLSVRGHLTTSEALAAGREFETVRYDPSKQDIPEISLEKRFAERTGMKIGDILEFNVQGISVKGRVVNLRRVRWASFQPNFFVQFQEGVIDDAPRTYLGTVGQTDFETTQKLQRELAQSFSNVSIVDVKASVDRILAISQQVALAITAMALLCLLAGMGVLTAITLQQSRARSYETAILKVLGASFREVYVRVLGEAAIVAFFAAFTGLAISFGIAWVLSVFIFDGVWVFAVSAAVVPALLIFTLTLIITMAASRIALGTNARDLLQSDA